MSFKCILCTIYVQSLADHLLVVTIARVIVGSEDITHIIGSAFSVLQYAQLPGMPVVTSNY